MGKLNDLKEKYDSMDNGKKIGAAAVMTALNPVGAVALAKTINDTVKDSEKPISIEQMKNESFEYPNVVIIEDKMIRQREKKFKSAIAWVRTHGDIDIMHLWDNAVDKSNLSFAPNLICGGIYYVDPQNNRNYINVDNLFRYAHNAKMAELDYIADCLGAKSYKINVYEEKKSKDNLDGSYSDGVKVKVVDAEQSEEVKFDSDKYYKCEGTIEQVFEKKRKPSKPELHWFKNDPIISGFVNKICEGNSRPKEIKLILDCSNSMVMSISMATKVDVAIKKYGGKVKTNLKKESNNALHSKIVYELFFE